MKEITHLLFPQQALDQPLAALARSEIILGLRESKHSPSCQQLPLLTSEPLQHEARACLAVGYSALPRISPGASTGTLDLQSCNGALTSCHRRARPHWQQNLTQAGSGAFCSIHWLHGKLVLCFSASRETKLKRSRRENIKGKLFQGTRSCFNFFVQAGLSV